MYTSFRSLLRETKKGGREGKEGRKKEFNLSKRLADHQYPYERESIFFFTFFGSVIVLRKMLIFSNFICLTGKQLFFQGEGTVENFYKTILKCCQQVNKCVVLSLWCDLWCGTLSVKIYIFLRVLLLKNNDKLNKTVKYTFLSFYYIMIT